jgi:hypothetical protein
MEEDGEGLLAYMFQYRVCCSATLQMAYCYSTRHYKIKTLRKKWWSLRTFKRIDTLSIQKYSASLFFLTSVFFLIIQKVNIKNGIMSDVTQNAVHTGVQNPYYSYTFTVKYYTHIKHCNDLLLITVVQTALLLTSETTFNVKQLSHAQNL